MRRPDWRLSVPPPTGRARSVAHTHPCWLSAPGDNLRSAEELVDLVLELRGADLALPDREHVPPHLLKRAPGPRIAPDVPGQLRAPIGLVGSRKPAAQAVVLMPEAPMDERLPRGASGAPNPAFLAGPGDADGTGTPSGERGAGQPSAATRCRRWPPVADVATDPAGRAAGRAALDVHGREGSASPPAVVRVVRVISLVVVRH